ncbi:tripartite tricarboxylate transporter TctB family protein [Fertoebacter nigrum]|uniref:Tripartite tricarboxylate transporter TctB family protein n=1 Tax=Fertoeibacter niger TaxID=2656921 RepID=A0A8X8KJJ7_9RHOB|nr:tripartite tricarboxylate transporter TctB family protein [Fertoeibacter niger]NUB43279.1 tripartite tricarboxylate transporter TctB family protein [Fertoeibacter niger]
MSQTGFSGKRRPDRAALIIAAALAVLGIIVIWDAARLPADTGYSGIGPADVPGLIGYGLIALGAWTAIAAFREEQDSPPAQEPAPVLWIIGGLGAQLVLIGFAGFSIATGILFACTARAFGYRRMLVSLPVGILFATVVYGLFDRMLQLNLPAGPLELLIYGG